jgi:hypothetical protein
LVAGLIRLSALFLFLCCPIFHEHISIVIFLQHVTGYVKLLGDIDRISFITFGTHTFSLLLRDFINSRHIPQVSVRLHLFLFAGKRYWDILVAVGPRLFFRPLGGVFPGRCRSSYCEPSEFYFCPIFVQCSPGLITAFFPSIHWWHFHFFGHLGLLQSFLDASCPSILFKDFSRGISHFCISHLFKHGMSDPSCTFSSSRDILLSVS